MVGTRRPGRPRSERARHAILAAALAELREHGYAETTIEGIAARASAGKQTIYRWWSSKADVVLDALLDLAATEVPMPDEGTARADLVAFLAATFRPRPEARAVLTGLMAQAVLDPVFGERFRDRFLFGRRAALRIILRRAVEGGELDAKQDVELLIDVVFGVLWYRMLVDHAPLEETVGHQLAALILRANAPAPGQPGRSKPQPA